MCMSLIDSCQSFLLGISGMVITSCDWHQKVVKSSPGRILGHVGRIFINCLYQPKGIGPSPHSWQNHADGLP